MHYNMYASSGLDLDFSLFHFSLLTLSLTALATY